ncbi:MAG: undecaprenyl/decaprenyl-phosphate alpha-N-acetylglucosaminyl 1-phosphate transferase [Thermoguttaceae bacterium]|nr:undecaprenyl/decaprenyl-phosphate alpha-N-acetylglucosaminyl 1-phosphate transferase [Thermoguttaceae bacterium]MDW8078413.1 MraY family glycosyltransferase [Thermoguttaceae bacterium]
MNSTLFQLAPQGVLVAVLGFLFSAVTAAIVCRLATRWGLVDQPDGRRKTHPRPTPLGGGVAVLTGTLLCLLVVYSFRGPSVIGEVVEDLSLLPLLAASLWIVILGLVDDWRKLRGRHKLLGQLLAAGILVSLGFYFNRINLFGWTFDLGILAVPFVVFWFVGAINSVNLLDGADGFAGTIGLIMTVGLAAMAAGAGRLEVALVACAFAGALAGFLVFNLPPAKMFLGDAGSMLIGLVIGALSIKASLKGAGTLLLAAPLALWAIPIIDSLAAILRRTLTGRSIYSTDRAHIHHRILERLGSNYLLLFVTGGIAIICAAGALGSVMWSNDWIAVLAVACVVAILVAGDLFGRGELYLLFRVMRRLLLAALGQKPAHPHHEDVAVHIQGQVDWESVWDEIRAELIPLGLERLRLDVNIPSVGESFHARWPEASSEDGENQNCRFQLSVPLFVGGQEVGALCCEGRRRGDGDGQVAAHLFQYAKVLERRIGDELEKVRPIKSRNDFAKVGSTVCKGGLGATSTAHVSRKFPR